MLWRRAVGGEVVRGVLRDDEVLHGVAVADAAAIDKGVVQNEAVAAAAGVGAGDEFPTVAGGVVRHAEDIGIGALLEVETRGVRAARDADDVRDGSPAGEHTVGGGAAGEQRVADARRVKVAAKGELPGIRADVSWRKRAACLTVEIIRHGDGQAGHGIGERDAAAFHRIAWLQMQVHRVGGAGGVDKKWVGDRAGSVLPGSRLPRGQRGDVGIVVAAERAADAAGDVDIAARREAGGVHARAAVDDGIVSTRRAAVAAGIHKDVVLEGAVAGVEALDCLAGAGTRRLRAADIDGVVIEVSALR